MAKSPVAIPFSTDGVEIPVKDATAVPADARGFIGVGLDGSTTRFIRVDASGRQVFVGGGIAGTPAGGVVSVQGVAGGTSLPVSVSSLPLPTGAATEATLATRATEATLLLVQAKTDNLDVALSTRATEATLATRLSEATFIARINTHGQKAAAASTPIVIASDQTAIPVSQNGTWTVQQGTPPWSVGVATVPAPLSTTGGGLEATALRVTIASDSTGLLSVDDNGGSLTVDTPQLPAALVGGRLDVVVGAALPAGTNNIGDVDVLSVPAPLSTTGGGVEAAALRVTIANDSTGLLSVDDNGGSLTVDTPQLPAALVGARLDTNIGAWLGATTPTVGQKAMVASLPVVIASDQSEVASKNAAASQVDGHSVSIGATTDADTALTVIGRLKQIVTKLAAGLPAALIGGRLDVNLGSWLGSTTPTVGQKAMTASIPVTLASNQSSVPVTFTAANARTGVSASNFILGGGTANSLIVMRATTYSEPTSAAQRSIASNNANDTSAGTGARTVEIKYHDNTGAGPFTETLTMNGTTAVNTVATNIRFIESLIVLTVGSVAENVGTITLYGATGGGGGTIGTIGVGNILPAIGDGRTLWAHHYVAVDWIVEMAALTAAIQAGGAGTSGKFYITYSRPLVTGTAEVIVDGVLLLPGAFQREFQFHTKLPGFARLTAYAIPSVNNTEIAAAFDWSEVPA